MRILSLLFFLVISTSLSFLQAKGDILFTHIAPRSDMSQMSVSSIFQDEFGSMWFATRQGLMCFNGNKIEVFNPSTSESNLLISSIMKDVCGDKNGHVFFSAEQGVYGYDLESQKIFRIFMEEAFGLVCDGTSLWFACQNRLYRYHISSETLELYYTLPFNSVCKLFVKSDKSLLIGTVSGDVYAFSQKKVIELWGNFGSQISFISKDLSNRYWIGTWQNGLYRVGPQGTIHFTTKNGLSDNFVRDLCEDDLGNIYIGTKLGLDKIVSQSGEIYNYNSGISPTQLSHESVWALHKDQHGAIWVGTYFGGVNYFIPNNSTFKYDDLFLVRNPNEGFPIISQIIEVGDGTLILCTEGQGLWHYDPNTKRCKVFRYDDKNPNSLSSDNIKSAYYDKPSGYVYLGMHIGGLCRYDVNKGVIKRYSIPYKEQKASYNVVRVIQPYKNNLLIGTYDGLYMLNTKTDAIQLFSNELHSVKPYIVDLKVDSDNNLWIGGQGVVYINVHTNHIECYNYDEHNPSSLSSNSVEKIFIDSKGQVWIATSGGGVNKFLSESKTFEHINKATSNLSNDFVSNLFFTPMGYLLITTARGFSLYDPVNKLVTNYGEDDGFPLKTLNNGGACVLSNKEIILAGMDGMVTFSEKDLSINYRPISLVLNNLYINNKLVTPNDDTKILSKSLPYASDIELDNKQNTITIDVTTGNYLTVHGATLRYKLIGYSKQWNQLQQPNNSISLMNLSPGDYTLVVQALQPNTNFLISEKKLGIRVNPPFYLTVWAFILYAIIIFSIIRWYLQFVKSKVHLRTSLEYEKRAKAHMEEINHSKMRFFINISHEFRTPLTLMVGQVDMLLQQSDLSSHIVPSIHNIKRNAENMQELISELMEFRKVEQGHLSLKVSSYDVINFMNDIYHYFIHYAQIRGIELRFQAPESKLMLWFDVAQMQKVFNNLISNAFKFTPKGGVITICVEELKNRVQISVIDSGVGIDEEDQDKIFDCFYQGDNTVQLAKSVPGTGVGLSFAKAIVELHHATISVSSEKNQGSRFTVKLLKGSDHFSNEELVDVQEVDSMCVDSLSVVDFDNAVITNRPTLGIEDIEKPRILIVEDNQDLRNMLVQLFDTSYIVIQAEDGEEGLSQANTLQPDIIITDLMMPRMSGFELCSKIKGNIETSHIPVVLLTAQTSSEFTVEGLQQGADDYITKPFDVKVLYARCANLLNTRKQLQEKFSQQATFEPENVTSSKLDQEFLEKAHKIVEDNLDNQDFDVAQFCKELGMGRTNLFSKMKGVTGKTPNDFILTVRLQKAASMLQNERDLNVSEIAYSLGFSSPKYFAKCFKTQFGKAPSEFRKG